MIRSVAVCASACIGALTAVAAAAPLDPAAFAYSASAPLAQTALTTRTEGGVRLRLVRFNGHDGRPLQAEIIAPASASPKLRPGVLFAHWLGDAKTTNHTEFESDARALAARGVTCVLVDTMWSTDVNGAKDWFTQNRTTQTDYANSIRQVIDLRRGLDLLLAQPGVDPARIAYVGHDFGCMYGAVLAGVDDRVSYYVLMAGVPTFAQWYLLGTKPADVAAYRASMSPFDTEAYLARSKGRAFFFQFASHDEFVSTSDATRFFGAAPLPRGMFVYDAHHDLDIPAAHADRLNWLEERLFG